MPLSPKQKQILSYLRDNPTMTKKEAISLIGGQYNNESKYVGETLARMVKRGLLVRVKRGVYKRGMAIRAKANLIDNPNQVKLF